MLNRRFTPFTLLLVSINGMVGSAWLFAPFYAAKIAGPGAIIAWIISGLGTIVIALTFAELSVMFPVAGGSAHIPQLSHGTLTSFIFSWIAWLSALTMAPIEVQAILQYASTYFTSLTYLQQGVPLLTKTGMLWATFLMLSFCVVNVVSYRGLVRSNFFVFVTKVGIICLTIVALIKNAFVPSHFLGIEQSLLSAKGWQAIFSAIATGGVAFAFTGFKHSVELAGETKRFKVAIPVAIVGSILCCLLIYVALQVAFIGAVSASSIAQGWQYLTFSGEVGPFAGLAAALGLVWLVKLLYIDAVISPAGAGLIYVTSTARILYAMGKIGYMPRITAYLNQQKFPVVAIFINFGLGMLLFLPLPSWQAMVSFLVSGMVISYAMGPIALLCLRQELPDQERGFRLPCAKLICGAAFYFCNLLSYWCGWATISKLAIAMVLGILVFMLASVRQRWEWQRLGLRSLCWLIPYFAGLVAISYCGAFGGENMIPFGWDFLIIAVFSCAILYLAVKSRATIVVDSMNSADGKPPVVST